MKRPLVSGIDESKSSECDTGDNKKLRFISGGGGEVYNNNLMEEQLVVGSGVVGENGSGSEVSILIIFEVTLGQIL